MRFTLACLLLFASTHLLMAERQAFPPTAVGTSEIKILPAGVLLRSESAGGTYFENSGTLFRPLFRYIDRRSIAMTTPVEARVTPARMYFWVAESEHGKVDGDADGVNVIRLPERTVASRGARGSYSRSNFESVRDELVAWLASNPDWQSDGEPYPVYWNGPATPWFAKRFEVHVPVKAR
jgi:hypothetical protein